MTRFGETAFLLRFPGTAGSLEAFARAQETAPESVADLVPGADSLLVVFLDPPRADEERWCSALELGLDSGKESRVVATPPMRGSFHRIPVVYDGPDLDAVAGHAGLHRDDVIARHASTDYRVAFVGFQPGFAYLSGLSPDLRTPRRATPRPRIPAGSVGIGGEWTGIYPLATPGGWQILGHTDVILFDAGSTPPSRLAPGDTVQLVAR